SCRRRLPGQLEIAGPSGRRGEPVTGRGGAWIVGNLPTHALEQTLVHAGAILRRRELRLTAERRPPPVEHSFVRGGTELRGTIEHGREDLRRRAKPILQIQ